MYACGIRHISAKLTNKEQMLRKWIYKVNNVQKTTYGVISKVNFLRNHTECRPSDRARLMQDGTHGYGYKYIVTWVKIQNNVRVFPEKLFFLLYSEWLNRDKPNQNSINRPHLIPN